MRTRPTLILLITLGAVTLSGCETDPQALVDGAKSKAAAAVEAQIAQRCENAIDAVNSGSKSLGTAAKDLTAEQIDKLAQDADPAVADAIRAAAAGAAQAEKSASKTAGHLVTEQDKAAAQKKIHDTAVQTCIAGMTAQLPG